MKEYYEKAAAQFYGLFNMLTVEGYAKTRLFRRLSNHVFRSLKFWKYITHEGHLFFKVFKT